MKDTQSFKPGDKVCAAGWCTGKITKIDGEFAEVESKYDATVCLLFKLSELRRITGEGGGAQ